MNLAQFLWLTLLFLLCRSGIIRKIFGKRTTVQENCDTVPFFAETNRNQFLHVKDILNNQEAEFGAVHDLGNFQWLQGRALQM